MCVAVLHSIERNGLLKNTTDPSATKATLVRKGRQIPWFVEQVIDMFSRMVNFDTMPSMHSALKRQTNSPKTT